LIFIGFIRFKIKFHNDEQYDNTTLTVGLASLTNISFIGSEKSALKIQDL